MKTIILSSALLLSAFTINAQSKHTPDPHVEFGIKGGLNISNVHVQNSNNPDSKASFHAGALAHIHLSRQFAIQPEIMYSGQGFKQTIGNTDVVTRLNYINLPVLAQFMFAEGFRLETGPQLGLLAAAHSKVEKTSTDIKDDFKGADFGWAFGLGYLSNVGLGIDARYNLGISNINDLSSTNVNNRVFQVGLFYQFRAH